MKKVLINFAEGLLSKEQMKKVRGGCGGGAGGPCQLVCNGAGPYSTYGCDVNTVRQMCGQVTNWQCGGPVPPCQA